MNHLELKHYVALIVLILLIGSSNSQTEPKEISLDYTEKSIPIDDALHYKLTIADNVAHVKVQTIPLSLSNQITFFISQTNAKPTYATALFKAEQAGSNTLVFSVKDLPEASRVLHLSIYSTKASEQFTLNCLKQSQPALDEGEEISLLSKYMSTYSFKPTDLAVPLFFYSIGANTEVFSMNVKLINPTQAVTLAQVFRNGYGVVVTLTKYPEFDIAKSLIEVSFLAEVEENIKFGVKGIKTQGNTIALMKETFGYLDHSHMVDCYDVPNEKSLILNILSYPFPVEIQLIDAKGDSLRVISTKIIDSIKLDLAPEVKMICFKNNEILSAFTTSFITYSFQFIDSTQVEATQRFLSPIINGVQSKFTLPPNKAIGLRKRRVNVFSDSNPQVHLLALEGTATLYTASCEAYPCDYSLSKIAELATQGLLVKANQVSQNHCLSYPVKTEPSFDSPSKILSVVSCTGGTACVFHLTMFESSDIVELLDNAEFHNPLSKLTSSALRYRLTDPSIDSITFVLYCYTGDTLFDVESKDHPTLVPTERFSSNKKAITIQKKGADDKITGDYAIVSRALEHSYYSFAVLLNTATSKTLINPGEVLLQSITENEKSKTYSVKNRSTPYSFPYVISFNSLNCNLEMTVGSLTQSSPDPVILNIGSEAAITVNFKSHLSPITNADFVCLFYLSGIEIEPNRELLLNEGVTHNMKLVPTSITSFSYIYPILHELTGDRIIVDLSYYEKDVSLQVTLSFEGNKRRKDYLRKLNRGRKMLFEAEVLENCDFSSMCTLHITVKAEGALTKEVPFTIAVKSLKKVPVYLKGEAYRKDVVVQSSMQYFYTNIGLNEEGEVMVSFNKGSGLIYARIVESDLKEADADYNNHLVLPSKEIGASKLLVYSYSKKRIRFSAADTGKCKFGCELYVGIEYEYDSDAPSTHSSMVSEFSIIKRGIAKDTVSRLNVNEYAYGSIDSINSSNVYTFSAPFDTNQIAFHLLSDFAILSISLTTPIVKTWELSDSKGILSISKADLGGISFTGLTFTLSVKVTKVVKGSSDYAIKVSSYTLSLPLNYLTSEQNEICIFTEPLSYCNLVRSVNGYEKVDNFFMLVESMDNPQNSFEIFANVLQDNKFETSFTEDDLPKPSNHQLSSLKNLKKNMLFIDNIKEKVTENYYIVISIRAAKAGKGLFLSSTISNSSKVTLNHSTKTLVFTRKEAQTLFKLIGASNYLVSYTVLSGKGELVIENQPKISLENSIIAELPDISYNNYEFLIKPSSDDLMYYISYTELPPSSTTKQLREIAFGQDNKLILPSPTLNSNYYFRVPPSKEKHSIAITLKFLQYEIKTKEGNEEFTFNCFITDSIFISSALDNPSLKPDISKKVQGVYDSIGRMASVVLNEAVMTTDEFYVLIELEQGALNKNVYSKLEAHITSYPLASVGSIYAVPQRKYYHDAIVANSTMNLLRLAKYSAQDNVMVIEFSSCVGSLIEVSLKNYTAISDIGGLEVLKNDSSILFNSTRQFNKDIITINITLFDAIGLVISRKEPLSTSNDSLAYVMKYKTGENINGEVPFKDEMKTMISITIDYKQIGLAVTPIANLSGTKVKADYIFRMTQPSATPYTVTDSICFLNNSQSLLMTRTTIEPSSNSQTFSSSGVNLKEKYNYDLSVVAVVAVGEEEELLGYQRKNAEIPTPPNTSLSWVSILFIVIGCTIPIALISFIIVTRAKRKRLQSPDILQGPTAPLYQEHY